MPPTVYGVLGIQDANRTINDVGQVVAFTAVQELITRQNESVTDATRVFVGSTTTGVEETYEQPGGGMMQEADRLTRPAAVKGGGRYTVGFPLRDARDQLAGDDITYAYMTLERLNTFVGNIFLRHLNWVRFNILKAFLNNANYTFEDETLSQRLIGVKRFANTDGTIYAPVISGVLDGADDNHYLVAGYLSSAINNTNNPFPVMRREIAEHFGEGDQVAFINSAQTLAVSALSGFIPFDDPKITPAFNAQRITSAAPNVPGLVIGRIARTWISEWDYIPADYMVGLDLNTEPPLRKRVDAVPVAGSGALALIARQQEFPLQEAFWRCREGYGVANRLNGVVMQFKASGVYDIPTAYAL